MPIDTYVVPKSSDHTEWIVARYWDNDGMWVCRHRHTIEADAITCAKEFAAKVAQPR